MNIFYDKDADIGLLTKSKIAVIGFGSQGHAHAQNLRDSGMDVRVGLREKGASWKKAQAAGLEIRTVAQAVRESDFVMMLIPDEDIAAVYASEVEPNIPDGATLAFAHGFNVHYGQVESRPDLDVVMIAPKAPGHTARGTYRQGGGVPALVAIWHDASGQSFQRALAYACAIGSGKAGIIQTDFREETETDLFGEQAVLCGGAVELIKCGFDTLTEAGYSAEMAYFECLHELKLIVDLIYEGGISNMNYGISNNAEFGEYLTGPKIVTNETRKAMRQVLKDIQTGEYAKAFIQESRSGGPVLRARRRLNAAHPIETVGNKLRSMMPWIQQNRLVDRSLN